MNFIIKTVKRDIAPNGKIRFTYYTESGDFAYAFYFSLV